MRSMKPDRDICVRKIKIPSEGRNIPALVLSPKKKTDKTPGILWIHGGGYIAGMKEMVHMSRAVDLVKNTEQWSFPWLQNGFRDSVSGGTG